ncbi:putative Polynucleotidyl transferase (phage related) [Magnetospirillum sp. XM-1]|nr:putative Polynucleotidyl transferase (phage related) [Magnetospirillum sp. XM-1]
MHSKKERCEINAVTDVTGPSYIYVTRACAHACTGYKGEPDTSVTTSKSAVLTLDLGSTTGWAMLLADGTIVSGTMQFRPSRYEGGGMRYLRFRSWLDHLLSSAKEIGSVCFEEVRRHAGTDAAHLYGGFLAHLSAWCELNHIPYQGVPVGTIKRHTTGKGNAGKDAVIAAMRSKGFTPEDDNEADALAILTWVIDTQGGVR